MWNKKNSIEIKLLLGGFQHCTPVPPVVYRGVTKIGVFPLTTDIEKPYSVNVTITYCSDPVVWSNYYSVTEINNYQFELLPAITTS